MFSAPFGLSALVFVLAPTQIGYQDVAALLARQPAVTAHWRQHMRASAFGTVQAATFSFSRPIGTAVPQPLSYQLASLDPRTITLGPWNVPAQSADDPPLEFPTVDRSAKGDRLPAHRPQREPTPEAAQPTEAAPVASAPVSQEPAVAPAESAPVETAAALAEPATVAAPREDTPAVAAKAEANNAAPEADPKSTVTDIPDPIDSTVIVAEAPDFTPSPPTGPVVEMARLYFGNQPLGDGPGTIEKWAPGEQPTIVAPQAAPADPDIKLSALDPKQQGEAKGGESIAPKGEVTGEGRHPMTPAERLGLEGKTRTKAEKCLANAVYFEARGEPVRGQIAVAQVVMNRVFSGYYPKNVCSAVYQNAHRRLACQFTFACDGIPDVVTEPQAWVRATRIARDVLDGKYWVPEVDRATHYHAYWVRPSWVREMRRLYKFGVHTFYRPRAWGDGSDAPSWGTAAATTEAMAKL